MGGGVRGLLVCQCGCLRAGRMEEMTVVSGLTGARHCAWDYFVQLNRQKMGVSNPVSEPADGKLKLFAP